MLRALFRSKVTAVAALGCTTIVLLAAFGPIIAPFDPNKGGPDTLGAPSLKHLMGTDDFGRDLFSRMLSGTRVSVMVGLGAVLIGGTIGTLLGIWAGMSRGFATTAIMRAMDVILAFPVLMLATLVGGITVGRRLELGPLRITQIVAVIGVVAFVLIPIFARVARATVLAESREEYMLAAEACGTKRRHLVFRHLLPNVQAPIVVQAAFDIGAAIVIEAAVSFLGLGVQSPQASWGNILSDGQKQILFGGWWLVIFPTAMIMISALCFNLLGDGLRDALDPRHMTSVVRRRIVRKERTIASSRVAGQAGS